MKNLLSGAAIAVIAIATPSTAFAQDGDKEVETFVGASVGYHDLGSVLADDDGLIYLHEDVWDISVFQAFAGTLFPKLAERIWKSKELIEEGQ